MKNARIYRFPPLDLLQAKNSSIGDADPSPVAALDQLALTKAYEQAQARGHAQGLEQGQQEGWNAGWKAGNEQGGAEAKAEAAQKMAGELQRLAAPIDKLMKQLDALHIDWQASLRKDVVDLVERVARQVVRCELTLQPAQILALVEETLQGMPQRTGNVHVYLNPADLQRIQELDVARTSDWNLLADSTLEAGECRLQVGDEEVDAGCKQRLHACMEQVKEQLLPAEAM